MKKLFSAILVMVLSFTAKGQTIDTSFHYCVAAKIQPLVLQVNYPAYDTCTHVGIIKTDVDYTTNQTTVAFYFGNPKRNVQGDNYIINDTNSRSVLDYLALIGTFLKITFK